MLYTYSMVKRTVIEVSEDARYLLKAVAALRGITMRELVEQTARELAKAEGVRLPSDDKKPDTPDSK